MSLGKSSSPRAPNNIPPRFVVEWSGGRAFCFSLFRAIHPCNFVLQNGEKTRRKKRDGSSGRGRRQRANRRIGNEFRRFLFFSPRGIMARCQTLALMGKFASCTNFPNNSKPRMGAVMDCTVGTHFFLQSLQKFA